MQICQTTCFCYCISKTKNEFGKNPEENIILIGPGQYYTITALERDQYEVLWSRVQQYWTRRSWVQYCFTLLHKTSYWSSSSVVIVLLHKALFYYNFVLFENFIILNFFLNIWNLMKFLSFEILWKFWLLNFWNIKILWLKFFF